MTKTKSQKQSAVARAAPNAAAKAAPKTNINALAHKVLKALPKGTFSTLGGAVGGPPGALAGAALSKVLGYGDYTVVENNLASSTAKFGGEVPQFANGNDKTIIRHREYVGPVVSPGTAFTNITYDINPGNANLFPWLAAVARSYQQYRMRGCVFIYKSLTSDYAASGGMGQVILATNYNVNDDDYSNTVQMQNSEYAVAAKPSVSTLHPLECATSVRRNDPFYVFDPNSNSTGATVDKRFRDMGKFQIATEGLSTGAGVTIGQLWVSYDVELIKPIIPYDTTLASVPQAYWSSPDYNGTTDWAENISADGVVVAGSGSGGFTITLTGLDGKQVSVDWQCQGTNITSSSVTYSSLNVPTGSDHVTHNQYMNNSSQATGHIIGNITSNAATISVSVPANTAYASGWVFVTVI